MDHLLLPRRRNFVIVQKKRDIYNLHKVNRDKSLKWIYTGPKLDDF